MFADLELAHHLMRMERRELAQQHHIVAVVTRIGFLALDHDRTVMARLFLQT